MLTLEREKQIRGIADYECTSLSIDALRDAIGEIDRLRAALKNCKHPNCCCVCGHTGKCPEDGPTLC